MRNWWIVFALSGFILRAQPKISFTFDDGTTKDRGGYALEEWNNMLLGKLESEGIQATLFATGYDKADSIGNYLLSSWDLKGHSIGNHTYTHPNFNSEKTSLKLFKEELIRTDILISRYENYVKLFRFPYLKEGNVKEKVDGFRSFLDSMGYKNGYVTVDASDWYIDSRLRKRLKSDPASDLKGFRDFYVTHLYERACFYEMLSYKLTGRHINHTLLLHHNLAAALFIDALMEKFKSEGWELISSDHAFSDPIFNEVPDYAGESLIWALTKDSGIYDDLLRYPAEDGKYEKEKMDELGL
ncbi:MAG: polysaccharide deacetylase family protein [Bacteroidota bacterium]